MKKKHSKRFNSIKDKLGEKKIYSLRDASKALKDMSSAKFDESIDMAFNLNVDPRHADQMVRGSVVLPNGIGKKIRVAVFAKDRQADEAKKAGADIVGEQDLCDNIQKGKMDFDIAIATPDMMPLVGKVGRFLGPKGLMPNPKTGTVTIDVVKAIQNAKNGQINFKVDKKGNIHAIVGKISFDSNKIEENIRELVKAVNKNKPVSSKGKYMTNVAVSLTMSPSIYIDSQELMDIR